MGLDFSVSIGDLELMMPWQYIELVEDHAALDKARAASGH